MNDLLKGRVQARLQALGINPFEAERRAHLKRGYVNDLLIGKKTTFRAKALPALAAALECDLGFLTGTQTAPTRAGSDPALGMQLSGIAEAGAWRDPDAQSLPEARLPIVPDPRYDPARISIYLVRGDHAAGLGITDGSIVSVLSGSETYREGDIVLAKRTAEDGMIELSIRVLSTGGALSARPAKGTTIPSVPAEEVEICGLVISAIRVFGLPN